MTIASAALNYCGLETMLHLVMILIDLRITYAYSKFNIYLLDMLQHQ